MCQPQPQHQGQKGVVHMPPGGLGEHLQGKIRSADLFGLSEEDFFGWAWDVLPTSPAPGTKRCRPCASWSLREHLAQNFDIGISARSAQDDYLPNICLGWTAWSTMQSTHNDLLEQSGQVLSVARMICSNVMNTVCSSRECLKTIPGEDRVFL